MLGSLAELHDRFRLEGRGQLSTLQWIVISSPSVANFTTDRTGRAGATVGRK